MERYAHAVYCDDIREEISGKISLIGVYSDTLFSPKFPTFMPKLCAVVYARTDEEHPFNGITFTAKYNDTTLGSLEISKEQLDQDAAQNASTGAGGSYIVKAQMIFTPVQLDKPGELSISILSEGVEIPCLPLRVDKIPLSPEAN